jgi:hydrogenase expression/formation protein HypE
MCDEWKTPPHQVLVVGDYLFDIQAGRSAGARTALIIGENPPPDYATLADHVIRTLSELLPILALI